MVDAEMRGGEAARPTMTPVDPVRLGLSLRALRIRRGWRQADLANRAGISRGTISALERGWLGSVSVSALARVATALEGDLDVRVRWRGAELDRLLDEGHARLVDLVAARLAKLGWSVAVEVTFSVYGERGSIDLLAFHAATGALLVVEMKTVVPDFQATVSALDRKARLAPDLALAREWNARATGRLLVIEATSTSRDRLARLGAAVGAAFPSRGAVVREWLARPSGALSGLLFVRSASHERLVHAPAGRQRVYRSRKRVNASHTGAPEPFPDRPDGRMP
jgi:transcriptional regulator with XRE-family HTH domain